MGFDDQGLSLTRGQLDIWLAQETGQSGTEWQLGLFVRIDGPVDRAALEWAIRRVVRETETGRAAFLEVDGQVFQKALDYPKAELAFLDLTSSPDPVQEATAMALAMQRIPMPFSGPLFKFALFRTRRDQFHLFACCHHIVVDGFGLALVGHRVATVYSAIVSGAAVPPAFFGSLQDLVDGESAYEASGEYLDDQAYWAGNLPIESAQSFRLPQVVRERDPSGLCTSARLDPDLLARVDELSRGHNVPRSSVITAACALLVRGWCAEGPEVVLDFPVNRRVRPESKTLPGMLAGVVPLVLRVAPDATAADFCEYVDTRIREALQHQRFPVHELEPNVRTRGPWQSAGRLTVNFVPSFTLAFGGATASATYTNNPDPVGDGFGFIFLSDGEQLSLSAVGAGQPFSNFDVSDLADRLQQVLTAMTADPGGPLSSIDVLAESERARLDAWGHREVLARPAPAGASIPAVFAEQVARTPEAPALTCAGRSWTYRE
ncbi:condensation domain-containing protein, partial [Mycobacterium sp. 94-17]|uniref:condensation domain-containing protein n=1 Tax=Mycobacterium sp. 94-17 TaxID=2986147 RepID=UPI002D1EC10B